MGEPLPVIVGCGGVNAAGRVTFHHAYRRTVIDAIGENAASETYASLAALMNVAGDSRDESTRRYIRDNTLIRRMDCFDPERIYWQRTGRLSPAHGEQLTFTLRERDLPAHPGRLGRQAPRRRQRRSSHRRRQRAAAGPPRIAGDVRRPVPQRL